MIDQNSNQPVSVVGAVRPPTNKTVPSVNKPYQKKEEQKWEDNDLDNLMQPDSKKNTNVPTKKAVAVDDLDDLLEDIGGGGSKQQK